MSILVYLTAAAFMGWLATGMMRDQSGLWSNIIMAVLGKGYYVSPLFNVETIDTVIGLPTMMVTLLGSIVLLAFVNLFRRMV